MENAIIHGLKGIDSAGEIKISFRWFNENVLECLIEDNGQGRFKANEMKAQLSAEHKSTALKVVQERLANLNQKSTFIPFEMIDLKDDSGSACGTKVILRILV